MLNSSASKKKSNPLSSQKRKSYFTLNKPNLLLTLLPRRPSSPSPLQRLVLTLPPHGTRPDELGLSCGVVGVTLLSLASSAGGLVELLGFVALVVFGCEGVIRDLRKIKMNDEI